MNDNVMVCFFFFNCYILVFMDSSVLFKVKRNLFMFIIEIMIIFFFFYRNNWNKLWMIVNKWGVCIFGKVYYNNIWLFFYRSFVI